MKLNSFKSLFVFAIIFLLLGVFILHTCSFSNKAAKTLYNTAPTEGYDAIIVPGVPFKGESWSKTMKARVLWSVYLYEQGIAKNIIYSGGAVHSPYVEAKIMAMYAKALGIPEKNIFIETKAEHSTENIYYSYQLAQNLQFQKIALASDPFQTKLLRPFVKKRVHPNVGLLPIVMDVLIKYKKTVETPKINYENAWVENFIPLKEKEGFWQRLRGTRGGNIESSH